MHAGDESQAARADPAASSSIVGGRALISLGVIAVVFVGALLMRGQGGAWPARAGGVAVTLLESGWQPALYLLGALGFGRIVRPWLGETAGRGGVELGVGLTIALSLTHLLGVLGLLSPPTAWALTGAGLVPLVTGLRRARGVRLPSVALDPLAIVIVCAGALALVMACVPPGLLWGSEYGGFDALSYHLQLPREWIEQGRIWPSEHNVYSFLPGYVESAYAHLALLGGGGMLAHDARAAMSTQLFSAMTLIASAWVVADLANALGARLFSGEAGRDAGRMAAMLMLCTPWMMVVGTLAYNEAAVVLLGASALLAAVRAEMSPVRRGVVCGLIVGGACGCKPTALFLLAPSVGVVLLASVPRRRWALTTLACLFVGALTVAPWLVRNALATGNPVFPHLSGVFGSGHWSEAQHAVYAGAHSFEGSLLDRFRLLVLPDAGGVDHVSRFRGYTNAQWGLTPGLALVGLALLLATRRTRRAGLVASACWATPVFGWALLTHLQSRFLVPTAPLLCVLGALAVAGVPSRAVRHGVSRVFGVIACLWVVALALVQNRGNPFVIVDLGAGVSTGSVHVEGGPWTAEVNRARRGGETVYLLGDATPFFVTGDVRYNTVYDRWLIEDAIERAPGDPAAWTRTLREAGVDMVVVGFSEIERYARSGWLPGSIDLEHLIAWIDTLGEPEALWSDPSGVPVRAMFRLPDPETAP